MVTRSADLPFLRIRSDYLGAGAYAVLPEDRGVAVNTEYGVQAVGLDGKALWQVELLERCVGVTAASGGRLFAGTLHAVHIIDAQGKLAQTLPTRQGVAREPLPWEDGMLVLTQSRLYHLDAKGEVIWRYRLREALGEGAQQVLVVGIFPRRKDSLVLGAVDYDTGLGRVLILNRKGELRWQSEPGPITDIFPVGDDRFLYTLSGYGRFESLLADIKGELHWKIEGGGVGLETSDGRIAIVNGNTEAPTWDDWELRFITTAGGAGKVKESHKARGRCAAPPAIGPDGAIYFAGFNRPFDPAESRIEYTSFVRPPRFVAYDHLLKGGGERNQDIFFFRGAPGEGVQLVHKDNRSCTLGPTVSGKRHVFFVHDRDLLALELPGKRG